MRFIAGTGRQEDTPRIDAFLDAIEAVCRTHGYSIGHEDTFGAFIIHTFNDSNMAWLKGAAVDDAGVPL